MMMTMVNSICLENSNTGSKHPPISSDVKVRKPRFAFWAQLLDVRNKIPMQKRNMYGFSVPDYVAARKYREKMSQRQRGMAFTNIWKQLPWFYAVARFKRTKSRQCTAHRLSILDPRRMNCEQLPFYASPIRNINRI